MRLRTISPPRCLITLAASKNASGPTGSGGAQIVTRDEDKKTFADVAGCQEAIDELLVVKKKIMRPKLYKIFGAPVPSGVILYGPHRHSDASKTLLAPRSCR